MTKYLAVLILFIGSSLSFAQTSTVTSTGNLIDPNAWSGAIYMTPTQLSQVEGTGGGPVPAYNTGTNTIRFSFMPYTVSQIQAINAAMFNNNTNIQVSGYNYSWKLYGDNGYLSVLGKLYDTKGSVLEQASYNYQFLPAMPMNWDQISGSSNFSTAYNFKTLGSLEFNVTGSDSLFWSGYYGPRIRDINVSFNYSVLPAPTTTTTTQSTSTGTPTPIEIADTFSKPPAEAEPQPQQTQQTLSGSPPPPPPPGSEPPPNSPPPPTGPAPQNSPPPSGNPQPNEAVRLADVSRNQGPAPAPATNTPQASQTTQKETTTASNSTKSESNSGPSLNNILAMIQTNQNKERAIAQNAVAQANEVAQNAVAQTEQTALSVAANSSAQSIQIATSAVTAGNNQEQKKTITNFENISEKNSTVASIDFRPNSVGPNMQTGSRDTQNIVNPANRFNNESNTVATIMGLSPNGITQNMGQGLVINNQVTTSAPTIQNNEVIAVNYNTLLQSIRQIQTETNISLGTSLFSRPGDPFQDYVNKNNITVDNETKEMKATSINRNAQDNDVAGTSRIERMAVVPVGFGSYSNFNLSNIAFYEPKEIYKNQKVIDNVRALRQLSSDRLHQEMVEQQYRR